MADAERYRMHAIVRESAGGRSTTGPATSVSKSADAEPTAFGHSPSVHGEDGDLLAINQRSPD